MKTNIEALADGSETSNGQPRTTIRDSLRRLLPMGIAFLPLLVFGPIAALAATPISPISDIPAPDKFETWKLIIPIIVPMVIGLMKVLAPKIPKAWLPVIAPGLGAAIDIIGSQGIGTGTLVGLALGSAGVGLREIYDQLTKAPSTSNGLGLLVLAGALALTLGTTGCQTTNAAGRTLATITVTADHAMQGWMHWVAMGKATPQDEQKVKAIYEKYQAAELAAETAYDAAYKTGDAKLMEQALAILVESRDELLALIAALQKKE